MAQHTPEQQALVALQGELQQTRAQLVDFGARFDSLAAAHTGLQQAHDLLRYDSSNALTHRANEIKALETQLRGLLFKQQFDLLDLKNMRPEVFKGSRGETWRPWARKFKAYCNGKSEGFRKALDWAEKETGPISPQLHGCPLGQSHGSRQQATRLLARHPWRRSCHASRDPGSGRPGL